MAYYIVKFEYKSNRSNTYELKIKRVISEIVAAASLWDFISRFNNEVAALPKESYAAPSSFYKCELNDQENRLEVWHLDSRGEKDRLVGYGTRHEVTEEEMRELNPIAFF